MGLTCIEVICMRWMPDEIPNKSVVFGFLNLPVVLLIVRKKNILLTKHEIVLLFVIEKQFANLVLCFYQGNSTDSKLLCLEPWRTISKTSASVSWRVPNTEKLMKARGRKPSAFIVWRCLELSWNTKHEFLICDSGSGRGRGVFAHLSISKTLPANSHDFWLSFTNCLFFFCNSQISCLHLMIIGTHQSSFISFVQTIFNNHIYRQTRCIASCLFLNFQTVCFTPNIDIALCLFFQTI